MLSSASSTRTAVNETAELSPEVYEAIKTLQCPGCVAGPEPNSCTAFKRSGYDDGCAGHVAGTRIGLENRVHLGMPKGFDKVGALQDDWGQKDNIRLFIRTDPQPAWDKLNVPVWYRFDGTYTFVRTFCPRIGMHYIDAFLGDHTADVLRANPCAFNVADFESEID